MDHNLRGDLIEYMNAILEDKDKALKAEILPGVGNSLHASQLQNMVFLYNRIQTQMFRLMATDSVPKFVKTERFKTLMSSLFHVNVSSTDQVVKAPMPQKEEISRAYVTISQVG